MNCRQEFFRGKAGLKIFCQSWAPESEIKAVLVIVHGIAEHSSRYSGLVSYLTSRGYLIYALDHRGHGQSAGPRGHVEHFSYFIDDLHTLTEVVERRHTGKKLFMFGHSMGATVALGFIDRYQDKCAGLILSGAALKVNPEVPVQLVAVLKGAAALFPKLRIMKLDCKHLSRDSAVVDCYESDPLVFRGKLSLRITVDLISETHRLIGRLSQIRIPLLVLHGEADQLTRPEGSRLIFERSQSKDKALKLYPGFYHEILNEPGHEAVLSDIENWLSRRL